MQSIFKSAKVIPVMVMGKLVRNVTYRWSAYEIVVVAIYVFKLICLKFILFVYSLIEYLEACMITTGVLLFSAQQGTKHPYETAAWSIRHCRSVITLCGSFLVIYLLIFIFLWICLWTIGSEHVHDSTNFYGIILLCGYITADSFTSQYQRWEGIGLYEEGAFVDIDILII